MPTRRRLARLLRVAVLALAVAPSAALAFGTIAHRSSLGSSTTTTNLVLAMPTGVAANDVLLAQVAVRGGNATTITAPAGWTFIRRENGNTTILSQALYFRVATASEPASYTWTFNTNQNASGGIAAYTNVDTLNPIDTSSGQASTTNGTTITAPSLTTAQANERLVGFFSTSKNQTITAPTGMTKRWDVTPGSSVQGAAADASQAAAGASGAKTATVSGNAAWVGQLVALKPDCSGGSLTLAAPSTFSFPGVTLTGTDQTQSVQLNLTADDETNSGSGWSVTGTSTLFTNAAGKQLPPSASALISASAARATGNCNLPTNSVSYPVTLPAGSGPPAAAKLYNATTTTGKGPSNLTLTFRLSVPANTYSGTYTSTWTFSIVSGP